MTVLPLCANSQDLINCCWGNLALKAWAFYSQEKRHVCKLQEERRKEWAAFSPWILTMC